MALAALAVPGTASACARGTRSYLPCRSFSVYRPLHAPRPKVAGVTGREADVPQVIASAVLGARAGCLDLLMHKVDRRSC